MANNTWVRQLRHFPLPGTATLFVLDRITILNYQLPLDRPIEGGITLDVEKRKQPGSDYSSYVSHGIDTTPIRIVLRLFKDLSSGKNWFENYDAIKNRLVPKFLSQRNAVPVYHPLLDSEGINSLIFIERSIPTPSNGQFFTVSLNAFNPRTLRIGSRGSATTRAQNDPAITAREVNQTTVALGNVAASTLGNQGSAIVGIYNQATTRPSNSNARGNYRGPGPNQVGQARRKTNP